MPQSLVSPAFTPLAPGSIRPRGWLLRQLEIQRDGLTGRLDEFWPDVRDSGWLGGPGEPWGRGPYWLDGVVPLAFLLDDGRLKAKAKRWIDHILPTQHDDGWLGPIAGDPQAPPEHKTYDTWPRYVVFKALTQWHEATGDPRVIPAMRRCCRKMHEIIRAKPLAEWARSRWAELVLSVHWL